MLNFSRSLNYIDIKKNKTNPTTTQLHSPVFHGASATPASGLSGT